MRRTEKNRTRRSRYSSTNSHLKLIAARKVGERSATKARCEPHPRCEAVIVSRRCCTLYVDDSHGPMHRRESSPRGCRASRNITDVVEVNEEMENDDDNDHDDDDHNNDDDDHDEEDIEERSHQDEKGVGEFVHPQVLPICYLLGLVEYYS